jgi:hypothetical protein
MKDQDVGPSNRVLTVDLRSGEIRTALGELVDRLDAEHKEWAAIGASAVSRSAPVLLDLPAEYGMTTTLSIHLIRRPIHQATAP